MELILKGPADEVVDPRTLDHLFSAYYDNEKYPNWWTTLSDLVSKEETTLAWRDLIHHCRSRVASSTEKSILPVLGFLAGSGCALEIEKNEPRLFSTVFTDPDLKEKLTVVVCHTSEIKARLTLIKSRDQFNKEFHTSYGDIETLSIKPLGIVKCYQHL